MGDIINMVFMINLFFLDDGRVYCNVILDLFLCWLVIFGGYYVVIFCLEVLGVDVISMVFDILKYIFNL